MAKDKKHRRNSCFLSCFITSEDHHEPTTSGIPSDMIINENNIRKEKSRWSFTTFKMLSKKSGAKTVPVDTAIVMVDDVKSEKVEARRLYNETRSKSKVRRCKSSEKLTGSKRRMKEVAPPAAPDQEKPREIKNIEASAREDKVEENRYENPEPEQNDPAELQRGHSFCRKIDGIRAKAGLSSQPGSPRPISRSTSFFSRAAPTSNKPQQLGVTHDRNLDPLVGMSIVLVTLIIMVLWGRVCAILCTCAWFYFIPLARSLGRGNTDDSVDPKSYPNKLDLSSEEYKKKVVLEGLLERNRRRQGS